MYVSVKPSIADISHNVLNRVKKNIGIWENNITISTNESCKNLINNINNIHNSTDNF